MARPFPAGSPRSRRPRRARPSSLAPWRLGFLWNLVWSIFRSFSRKLSVSLLQHFEGNERGSSSTERMASRSSATTKTLAVGRVANRPARAMGRGPRTSSSSSSSRPACPGSRGRPSAVRPAGIASGTRTRALGNGHDNPGASKVLVVEGDTRVGVEVVKTFLSHSGDFKVAATVRGALQEPRSAPPTPLITLDVSLARRSRTATARRSKSTGTHSALSPWTSTSRSPMPSRSLNRT